LPGFEPDARETRRLLAMFALGSVVWTWRAAIPVSLAGGAGALALLVVDPFGLVRSTPAVGLMLGYLIVVVAFHPRLRLPWLERAGDYSYGLYVYAFPIQQALIHFHRDIGPGSLTLAALPLTLAVAALSWHLVEQPALAWKPVVRLRRTAEVR
jgi:peptidoglycan/LPS O-acetylase OafA/YrhL